MSKKVCASIGLELHSDGTLGVSMTGTRAYLSHLLSMGSVEVLRRIEGRLPEDRTLFDWLGVMHGARDLIQCRGGPHIDARLMSGIGMIDFLAAEEEQG